MKKWKKLLLPAMCVFILQTPVIANAEATGSSDGAAAVVEDPVAAPTPALLNGIIKKGSKTYYYKDGVMQKNCWSTDKKQYFGKNGVAYAAPKESGYKKNVVVKKIGKKYYGFDRNGYKVKKGDQVKQGDVIGISGTDSDGRPVVYFELRKNNIPVNPETYFQN